MARAPRLRRTQRPPRSRDGWLLGWGAVAVLIVFALIAYILIYRPHP